LGIPGVQTLLFAMLHLVSRGDIDLPSLVRLCAWNPAQRFGLDDRKGALDVGYDADIIVLDPRGSTTVRNADQFSKAQYSPFDGLTVPWGLKEVLLRGTTVSMAGAAPAGLPAGQVL
jgi:dihydroorotase